MTGTFSPFLRVGTRRNTRDPGVPAADPGVLATLQNLGLYQPATPTRLWTGGVTESAIAVAFDVTATLPGEIETVGAAVATDATMINVVALTSDVPPTVTEGIVASYTSAAFTIGGLAADTRYYVAPRINGETKTDLVAALRTAPPAGTAKSFNFVVGSCTNGAYQLGNPYAPVAALEPAFIVHCGDIDYSDIMVNDPRAQRDRNTRTWRDTAGVQEMLLACPLIYMPDDHDAGPDDNHWDQVLATRATHAQIMANTRQVVRETTPRFADWNQAVLSQSWTWGRVRFILPDLRAQRRYTAGGPTFLGDGIDPPTGYDHITAVLAAIDQAATDGMKMLVFISTSTWAPAVYDSWDRYAPAEQAVLAQKFRDSPVHVLLIHGDAHQGVIDDGTYSDRSILKDGKLPLVCSSGWNWGAPFHGITDVSWNGADGDVTGTNGNATMFVEVEVDDAGGNNIHWTVKFWGAPLSGSSATLLATYRDDDAAVEAGFATASALKVETGRAATLTVRKSWFGPIPGCTVNYAWASGPSGTVTFTPNRNTADIPRAYTTGLADTVTLSSPVRCSLGAITSRQVQWITLEAETSAWLAQVTTRPNDELLAALNDFIAGLKSDGLWTQILKLWWLGAPTEQASTIEFKSPGISTLVKHGAMAFSALQGWRGGNSSGASVPYLETGYAIPAGNQNSMAAFVRSLEAVTSFAGEFGGEKYYINPRSTTATDFRTRSASITSDSLATIAATAGSFGISRTGSASYKKFIDGAAVETVTRTSTVPDATTMWLCSWQNTTNPTLHQSGGRRVAMAMIAAGLSDADVLKYYNRETTFLQAIGTL